MNSILLLSEVRMPGDQRLSWESVPTRVEEIEKHHVYDRPPGQATVLVLHCLSLTDQEAANVMGNSPSTVEHQAQRARERVIPPHLPTIRPIASFWTVLHRRCCVATAWARVLSHLTGGGKSLLE